MRAVLNPVAAVLLVVLAGRAPTWAQREPGEQPLESPRSDVTFSGRLAAGERFERRFGPDFTFLVTPNARDASGVFRGWTIAVHRANDPDDLSYLTVPWRFGARSVYIEAWHFLPGANAPGRERLFVFAPDVGKTLTYDTVLAAGADSTKPNRALDLVYGWGRGELQVRDYALVGSDDSNAGFQWIDFSVRLSWPRSYDPRTFKARTVE